MPSRAAKITSAIFANILAAVPLAAIVRGETVTAESCLSAPGNETPAGSHWRYRVDHVNKRNCWYLRKDGGALSQAVPQSTTAAAPVVSQPPAKPSIANARAELRPQDNTVASPPANAAGSLASGAGDETGSAATSAWNATAAVTTRWPDLPPASQVPAPAAVAAVTASADEAATLSVDPAQAIIPSIPLANLSIPIRPETLSALIAATIGAMAFAGAAALISRRSRRRLRRHVAQSVRGPLWETTDDDRIILTDQPSQDVRDYRPQFARGVASATSMHRAREFTGRAPRQASR